MSSSQLSVSCPCGVVIRASSFDQLVVDVTAHAGSEHDMTLTREQVREMASTDPD
ncbi:MAG: DUF1059 domain-containing protein [Ilumatobacteraceae bacterium]